jgi:flavin reductase (DIM6/NTAB) family NADH-FMN oxidoreductase RutF
MEVEMRRRTIELGNAYRLLGPGSVLLVSVGDGEQDNLFTVAWNMPLSKDPPRIGLESSKGHYSYEFIERTGEFALNVTDSSLVDAVLGCGSVSGRDGVDKFERFGLTRAPASVIGAPLVEEALASLECRVDQVVDLGGSVLLIASVVAAVADPERFRDGEWHFAGGLELIHHLGADRFCVSDRAITGRKG